MNAFFFFSPEEKRQIERSIRQAETLTSCEIRLRVEKECKNNLQQHVIEVFRFLGMDRTKNKNGILFYISIKDQKIAILGDKGVNKYVSDEFWNDIYNFIRNEFSKQNYCYGLSMAIIQTGKQLAKIFPVEKDDVNELPNEISFDTK